MRSLFFSKFFKGYSLSFFAAYLFLSLTCYAQTDKIDSLKRILPSLKDTLRVDCLNAMSYFFILAEQKDSAEYYATLAYNEASQLQYTHGMAVSYSCKAQAAKHFDDDFKKSEVLGKQALYWSDRTSNKEGIYTIYSNLIHAVFAQSKFEEAIDYAERMVASAKQSGNQLSMLDGLVWMCAIYRQSGNYEKSFLLAQQRYELAVKLKNKITISSSLYIMAQLYELTEDYQNALQYFRRVVEMDGDEIRNERVITDNDIWFKMEFAEAFSHLFQFDSAWHYYRLFKPSKQIYLRVWWISTGECYYLQKDYFHALQNFQLGLPEHQKRNDRNEVMRSLLDIGKTYLAMGKNPEALKYGHEGLQIALETKAKQFIRDGDQILSTVYDRLHKADSANFYFRRYITMKDEVLSDQIKGKFAAYTYEQKIALIDKEKEIQQTRLKNETFIKKVLIAGIVLLILTGVILLRNISLIRKNEKQQLEHQLKIQQLESERTNADLQNQATELEMQALRAQMNPHFIFNSLNSINRFILQNNKLQASEYLTKFSRLVRLILQNSQSALISLETELEALQLYLQLEALRFDNHFDYAIHVESDVDTSIVKVPPLIIQPYAENAIWHGLMHKKEKGHLEIDVFEQYDLLCFRITDDGIGRRKAAELKSKSATTHKSMGMRITADRITILHQNKQTDSFITVNDLSLLDGSAGGTEVLLKIPISYD